MDLHTEQEHYAAGRANGENIATKVGGMEGERVRHNWAQQADALAEHIEALQGELARVRGACEAYDMATKAQVTP